MYGEQAYAETVFDSPTKVVVTRSDNGFVVHLVEAPSPQPPKEIPEAPDAESFLDEQINAGVDGIIALFAHLQNSGDGDAWKGDGGKEAIRKGIKALMRPMPPRALGPFVTQQAPRVENKVFEKKSDLLAYLDENL